MCIHGLHVLCNVGGNAPSEPADQLLLFAASSVSANRFAVAVQAKGNAAQVQDATAFVITRFHRKFPGMAGGMAEVPQGSAGSAVQYSQNILGNFGLRPQFLRLFSEYSWNTGQLSLGNPLPRLLPYLELSYER